MGLHARPRGTVHRWAPRYPWPDHDRRRFGYTLRRDNPAARRGLALLISKPARPVLHHRVALASTAAVDRSCTAELGDELKKPLQALREAGRAKPRRIFAATFFRLQHVSPISRSSVSQLVTLCLSSPVGSHGANLHRSPTLRRAFNPVKPRARCTHRLLIPNAARPAR